MDEAKRIFNSYLPMLQSSDIDFSKIGNPLLPIPKFSEDTLTFLCSQACEVLEEQPPLLEIDGTTVIVGDLHGNIRDLIRIIASAGLPPLSRYLFLGDYVDRGSFSVEVISLLISLLILFPESIHLLRGNHEFEEVNSKYGFLDQVKEQYKGSTQLAKSFQDVFDMLPIAAVVNKTTFCVHGGLSPHLNTTSQVAKMIRPIHECENEILQDLMWSDPTNDTEGFLPSSRGKGCLFGVFTVISFLKTNGFKKIVRAHQFIPKGVRLSCNGLVYTVFSSSNYKEETTSPAAILKVGIDEKIHSFSFQPLERLARAAAKYILVDSGESVTMSNTQCFKSFRSTHAAIASRMIVNSPARHYSINVKPSTPQQQQLTQIQFTQQKQSPLHADQSAGQSSQGGTNLVNAKSYKSLVFSSKVDSLRQTLPKRRGSDVASDGEDRIIPIPFGQC